MRQEICDYNLKCGDYVVELNTKYSFEEEWHYHRELLSVGYSTFGINAGNKDYCWMNDWDEGQQDVEILWIININDIPEIEFLSLEYYLEKD